MTMGLGFVPSLALGPSWGTSSRARSNSQLESVRSGFCEHPHRTNRTLTHSSFIWSRSKREHTNHTIASANQDSAVAVNVHAGQRSRGVDGKEGNERSLWREHEHAISHARKQVALSIERQAAQSVQRCMISCRAADDAIELAKTCAVLIEHLRFTNLGNEQPTWQIRPE